MKNSTVGSIGDEVMILKKSFCRRN